jgi:hypothetical protein
MRFSLTLLKTASAVLMLLFSVVSFAKSLPDSKRIDSTSETFMKQIIMGESDAAFSLISAYVGVNLEQFTQRGEKITADMNRISKSAGQPLSYSLLKRQSVDSHFYKLTYLVKYRSAALVWELNYYQANKGWHLVDVSFNTNINALFTLID